jgi:hypothetical protein
MKSNPQCDPSAFAMPGNAPSLPGQLCVQHRNHQGAQVGLPGIAVTVVDGIVDLSST